MRVRVDQAREDDGGAEVVDLRAGVAGEDFGGGAGVGDEAALDGEGGVREDGAGVVLGDEVGGAVDFHQC